MKMRAVHVLLLMVISALVGYYVGITKINFDWKNYQPHLNVINKEPPSNLQSVDFAQFWNVWQKLETTYYDKSVIDPQKMVNGAISGMVESLGDPYTVYLPAQQNDNFKQGLAGQFTGIGAELGMKDKQIVIVAPLAGSPAEKAGVKAGDAVVKVDGKSTFGWTLSQAVDKIRGPKGSDVMLSIVHRSEDKLTDVKIQRDTITINSVDGWVKDANEIPNVKLDKSVTGSVMYIRLSQFGDNTNKEWLALINKLVMEEKQKGNTKGIILDLRNNPGGYLTDATYVASEFIKSGTVVIQDRGNGDQTQFPTVRQGVLTDLPMIVMVNKGSASASEIVAGAMRDHNRAKLLGETSFGKGTIQQAEDLGEGAGIHITIAKWLTPNGTWVHGKGLTPDIAVDLDPKDNSHDTQLERAVTELLK